MRYRAFRRKKDNLFYFQFLSEENDVILNSQSYSDKEVCFNGIRSVISNAGNESRYEKSIDGDSKHFFILKAENGQEIGRSIKYETEADVDKAIANFIEEGPSAASKTASQTDNQGESKNDDPQTKTTTSDPTYQQGSRGTDDYKPLAFYEARISGNENGFDQFDGEDGEFYFTYNLAEKVILISEGYKSDKSRDNGIQSVEKNLPIEARYQKQVHENGKHYFNLKAGNNQEIATSRWFDSEAERDTAIAILIDGGAPNEQQLIAAGLLSPGEGDETLYKDYKPLAFYEANISGEEFGFDPFTEGDAYYFSVNYDGTPVLISEDYTSEGGRDNGIKSVKRNVKNEKRYERKVHPNGMHYFNLLAGNKQEIATSRWFESKKDMERAISWLLNTGGSRRRKKATRSKPAAERIYITQGQAYLCNNITYDTFQSGGNQKYYFVFKDKDGKAVLINGDVRGFNTQEEMKEGIKAVLKYGPKDGKYDIRSTKNGKLYFYIKNEEEKNIARSSLFYDTEEEMRNAMALIQCVGVSMAGAAPAGKSEAVIDDYLPCKRYEADGPNFHKFQDEDSKEYYFSFNDSEGNVLLRSEGYTTEAARDNGIASVEKNAPLEERWTTGTALNDKYYYYALKAGNHQEIARSCYSDNEADMRSGLALTKKMFAPEPVVAAPQKSEAVTDDYLACERYAGDNGFYSFTNEENGEHYFAFNRPVDGKTLLRSEGYTQTASRDNGIQSVIKNAPIKERWSTDTALNGKYHFYLLKAGNNQEIARSCYYEDQTAMLADMNWIQGEDSPIGFGSALVNGTLMSAGMLRLAAEEEAAAKAEEVRLAAEAEALRLKKEEEEKAAAAALAAAAAAEALRKKQEEEARLAAEAKAKKEEEEKAAALAAAAAAAAKQEKSAASAQAAYTDNDGNKGGWGWLPWLLLALAALALIFFLLRGCDGCNKTVPPPVDPDPVPVDTSQMEPEPSPEPYGKDGAGMGYTPGTLEYLMANHLAGFDSNYPSGNFDADGVTFSRNSSRLNSAARKQLDNVIAVLKEYPNARIDIYGYITDNESGSGNKEISLDDERAKAVYDYLRKGGIEENRMNFQGEGIGDRRSVSVRILARE